MATLEEAFEEFRKLPDWDRFPMPEVFYEHFKVKKPQPSVSLMESLTYSAPPHESLNQRGKVEIRPAVEGGVRPMPELLELPTEVTLIKDETADETKPDSVAEKLSLPTEDSSSEILPGWDQQSLNPFYASPDNAPSGLYREVPLHNQEHQSVQNELS